MNQEHRAPARSDAHRPGFAPSASAPPLSASGLAFDMKKGHARRCAPGVPRHCFSLCLAPERPRKLVTRQELRERSQRGDSGYNETLDHLLSVVGGAPDIAQTRPVVRGPRRSEKAQSPQKLRFPIEEVMRSSIVGEGCCGGASASRP